MITTNASYSYYGWIVSRVLNQNLNIRYYSDVSLTHEYIQYFWALNSILNNVGWWFYYSRTMTAPYKHSAVSGFPVKQCLSIDDTQVLGDAKYAATIKSSAARARPPSWLTESQSAAIWYNYWLYAFTHISLFATITAWNTRSLGLTAKVRC